MIATREPEEAAAAPAEIVARSGRPVTTRSVVFGLFCALLICGVTPYNDYLVAATYLSGNFFPIGALAAVLLLVLLVNPLLITLGQRHQVFRPGEIITVWAMVIVAAGIPSSGLMRYLLPHIVAPHYFASDQNHWDGLFLAHLPSYLFVNDPAAVHAFFDGLPRGEAIPWAAWAVPLGCWSLFVGCLFLTFFCLSGLLRKPWVENERLAFPLVKLPVLLAETPEPGQRFNSLLRSPLLWISFGLVTALHTIKGVHQLFPTVPDIALAWHTTDFLHGRPWDGMGDIGFFIYPLVIGFSYLMASDVCLSLWLFYLLFKAQVVAGVLYNWDMSGTGAGFSMGPAYTVYQEVGGAAALAVWTLWTMRSHLSEVWRKAVKNAPDVDDSREPLSYRFAFFGLVVGVGGMFLWLTLLAKMQPAMAAGILIGALVVFLVLSWLVAQAGLLFVTQTFATSQVLTVLGGTLPFDARSLVMASLTEHIGWQDSREFMLPPLLNSLKGAAETGLSGRSLSRALALCVLCAVLLSGAVSLWLPYTHGGASALNNPWMYSGAPQLSFQWAAAQAGAPHPPQIGGILQMAAGALFVLILFLCRAYFPAFGLHPAGFLVAASYAMYYLWFSLLLGWLLKVLIVRYGGMRVYRSALPFFLGLVLGDCVNALAWVVVGLVTGKGYQLMPG
ncbi:MAG: DUF6785 family protein [Janthinobacterium lividum]